MADPGLDPGWSAADVARVDRALMRFGLPDGRRLAPEPRARLAALVAASAADARPPLDSPHRMTRGAARLVKAFLRRLVWSRTGAPLERQAEFNTALIRVTSEMLASDGASGPGLPVSDGLRAGSL